MADDGIKPPKNLGGRPPGTPNKTTSLAREALARFVDANIGKLSGWLAEIEQEHGALIAFKCLADVIEYHVPKLQRTELTGADGGALQVSVKAYAAIAESVGPSSLPNASVARLRTGLPPRRPVLAPSRR